MVELNQAVVKHILAFTHDPLVVNVLWDSFTTLLVSYRDADWSITLTIYE